MFLVQAVQSRFYLVTCLQSARSSLVLPTTTSPYSAQATLYGSLFHDVDHWTSLCSIAIYLLICDEVTCLIWGNCCHTYIGIKRNECKNEWPTLLLQRPPF